MIGQIKQIEENILARLNTITRTEELEEIRISVLGKKGTLTLMLRDMKNLDQEQRKEVGKEGNRVKTLLENLIEEKQKELNSKDIAKTLDKGRHYLVM